MSEDTPVVTNVRERTPRIVTPVIGAMPVSDEKHTRFVYDDPKRIRQMQQRGYQVAKESDVVANHDGYKEGGVIRNGDTVLMVAPRQAVEEREKKRLQELHDREYATRNTERNAELQDIESPESFHGGKGTKFYSIG